MTDVADRGKYIEDWAKQLKVGNNPWFIVEHLVNKVKNYDSAAALMFGLSWMRDRDYLNRATKMLSDWHKQSGQCIVTATELHGFMSYYIENVENLPT